MNIASIAQAAQSAQTTTSKASPDQSKLADAAQQFEGMLLQEMLKPMRSGDDKESAWASGDDSSSDPSSDTINGFGVEAVATAIAKGGGLGMAKQVMQQVTAEHDKLARTQHKS
ncbi:MAG TPA: hypothetical protein VGB69_11285 [Edaphobacter sp.]